MDIRSCVATTVDGRSLRVDHADLPDGFPVLVHAGSPGSRRMLGSAVELAASSFGLRLISYDRPGYGDSPAAPGRRVADAAADATAIAAELGLSRMATWGHSGGGPYALACAALLPGLVVAGCVFASPGPVNAPGLDFAAGWSDESREEFELFFREPELARELQWSRAQEALPALSTAAGWLARFGEQESTASARTLELANYLALVQQDTLCRGDEGWWEDNVALLSPWGFAPADISVPVQLWHGGRDAAVPPAHGRWLASQIPAVEAHLLPDDDHGSIHDDHMAEAYGWLRQFG